METNYRFIITNGHTAYGPLNKKAADRAVPFLNTIWRHAGEHRRWSVIKLDGNVEMMHVISVNDPCEAVEEVGHE